MSKHPNIGAAPIAEPASAGRRLGWPALGKLARETATIGTSSFYAYGCAAAALILNARALGAESFGVFATIQAYVGLIAAIATLESWQVVVRLGNQYSRSLPSIVGWGLVLDAAVSILATIVAVTIVLTLGGLVGIATENRALCIIYSLSLLGGVTGTPKGLFRFKRRYDILSWLQIARGTSLVAAAASLYALNAALNWYIIVYAAIGALTNLAHAPIALHLLPSLKVRRIGRDRSRRSQVIFRHFITMAIGTSILATLKNARRNALVLLAGAVLDATGVGLFAIASRLSNIVFLAAASLNQVIFPEVFRVAANRGLTVAQFTKVTVFAGLIGIVGMVLGYILCAPIVTIVAGAEYRDAAETFFLLFATECVFLAAIHFDPIVQRLAGTRPLILTWLVSSIPTFALAAVCGVLYGSEGIAGAVLLANLALYFVVLATAFILLKRHGGGVP